MVIVDAADTTLPRQPPKLVPFCEQLHILTDLISDHHLEVIGFHIGHIFSEHITQFATTSIVGIHL